MTLAAISGARIPEKRETLLCKQGESKCHGLVGSATKQHCQQKDSHDFLVYTTSIDFWLFNVCPFGISIPPNDMLAIN